MTPFRSITLLLLLIVCFPGAAFAQTGIDAVMNKIIRSTPGITNIAIPAGVRVGATGTVAVTGGGLVIPVATSVTADVTAAAIAKAAGRIALRVVPVVGTAIVVGEIAGAIKDSGVKTCPPPDFFCKPSPADVSSPSVYGGWTDKGNGAVDELISGDAVCQYIYTKNNLIGANPTYRNPRFVPITANNGRCFADRHLSYPGPVYDTVSFASPSSAKVSSCPDGFTLRASDNQCVRNNPSFIPAQESDLQAELNRTFTANASLVLKLKQQMDDVAQANPGVDSFIDYKGVPAVVTAAPYTSDPKVVSTNTISNADGSTSTQRVTQQTTVTPVASTPSTVMAPNISYPSVTTTTTTTTNNTTNVVTTNVLKTDNPSPVATPEDLKLPTDYNREKTQLSILQQITEFNKPITAEAPTGDKELETVQKKIDEGPAVVAGITAGGMGIVSWFPTVPTTACRDPMVPNAIGGGQTAVPICAKVDIFSKFISAVICVFALFGCVREVQSALKA
jgi:hypothetical protein